MKSDIADSYVHIIYVMAQLELISDLTFHRSMNMFGDKYLLARLTRYKNAI